ncbi:AAA family ATPase [Rhizobium indigoferae]|uniref:AAA family ATPase n=1 Tax=Rhizobium indigoferae TaxID=158891 RepID=A0ABZ1DQF0_9HYPH|nr:AAA family ATPase [Rhizobium indigoferae]NNU57015.1 AAA family ATPase [Rhizobium indigoferae]WRW37697.1 AAA family ATPase [Rhizobium indigoferae]GLR60295.1 hypothetical protein GCM10007919_50230 [Rhizobium indigoferae]
MEIEEIRLKDFRCFYGESTISFSGDPERNVTIIYAENGVGKTTLLNALLWCFYGQTTARFEKSEDILNYDAKAEGRMIASVEVRFEHNGSRYVAKRFQRSGATGASEKPFRVARLEAGSQIYDIEPEDTFINTVIPREMAGHFLFDGEHAEIFLGEQNRAAIRDAVRDILGCTLIETAIEDLEAISKAFRRQMPGTGHSTQITDLNNLIDTINTQIDQSKDLIAQNELQRRSVEDQITDIEDKLRNTAQAKGLQGERDSLQGQMVRAERRRSEQEDDVLKWLGDEGRFIVSRRLTEEAFEFIDSEEHRGRIPSPYNEEFVRDLLHDETCICGAHIAPGSEIARKVASLLNHAANQAMRDRVTKVRGRLTNLKAGRAKAPERLMAAKRSLAHTNEEIGFIEARLADVSAKLKGVNFGDIAERESRREELRKELSTLDRARGTLEENLKTARHEVARHEREINLLAAQDVETRIFARRRALCEKIKGSLEVRLRDEEAQAKKVLRATIRKIIEATSRKNLTLQMSDDYVVSLRNADGIALPKSSGENQLLGLAFTAALVQFAKLRKGAQDMSLLPGTIAPLVLDSPFGQLDRVYRSATAEFIPRMASQVVLLLSQSQAADEVMEKLQGRIGKQYVLVRHNKGERGLKHIETRQFGHEIIETTLFEASFDGTSIVEVQ